MTLTRHNDLSLRYVLNVPSGKGDDAPLPLVIVMHGRGADANDLADEFMLSDAEAGLALVLARHCHKRQSPIQGNYWRSLEG